MQVNNIFSISRFGAYFKKHLVDNYRLYIMCLVVLTGLLLSALLFVLLVEPGIHSYTDLIPFFLMGLYVAGLIFTSKSFSELGNKSRGIDYLLLPASHLEKFLTTLFVTTIGFLSIYHFAFFLAVKGGEAILAARHQAPLINDLSFNREANGWWINYFIWFVAQAMFLLGTLYFRKYSLLKTILSFMIFIGSMYLINAVFAQIIFHQYLDDWRQSIPFLGVSILLPHDMEAISGSYAFNHARLELPKSGWKPLLYFFEYVVPLTLWTVGYFKLRDKEI